MDFSFYRNFIIVAETGNISTAAKRLNMVQPALSAQIKTLEKYYQVQLFKTGRGKRCIELTSAGESFLQQAKLLCAAEDGMNLSMQSFSTESGGTLRFSVSHLRSDYFLERFLIPFAKAHPQVNYQFHDATVAVQLEQLARGEIDFAFANAPLPRSEEIETFKVNDEFFYAFFRELPHAWQGKKFLLPEDLENLPLCCNFGSYALLRDVCQSCGVQPKVKFIAGTAASALRFAAGGLGIAVVAALEDDPLPEKLARLAVRDAKLAFAQSLYRSRKQPLTLPARKFLDFFKKMWEDNGEAKN